MPVRHQGLRRRTLLQHLPLRQRRQHLRRGAGQRPDAHGRRGVWRSRSRARYKPWRCAYRPDGLTAEHSHVRRWAGSPPSASRLTARGLLDRSGRRRPCRNSHPPRWESACGGVGSRSRKLESILPHRWRSPGMIADCAAATCPPGVTHVVAVPRLLPRGDRGKDAEIRALRHRGRAHPSGPAHLLFAWFRATNGPRAEVAEVPGLCWSDRPTGQAGHRVRPVQGPPHPATLSRRTRKPIGRPRPNHLGGSGFRVPAGRVPPSLRR